MNIWIKDERANLVNFRNALKEFELGDHDYIINGPIITGWTTVQLISGIELDIMTDIKGINKEDYDLIYSNSPEALIESVSVKFLHLNQLIQTKEASNRPKDQVDLQELRKIREEKEQNTY